MSHTLTIKQFASEFATSPNNILAAIRIAQVEPSGRREDNIPLFDFRDVQDAYLEYLEQDKEQRQKLATDLFAKIMPDLIGEMKACIRNEIELAINIRKSREDKLVATLIKLQHMLIEQKELNEFSLKALSLFNKMDVADITPRAPIKTSITESSAPTDISDDDEIPEEQEHLFQYVYSDSREGLFKNKALLLRLINASYEELKLFTGDDWSKLESSISFWNTQISDLPSFRSFFASFDVLNKWIDVKISNKVPGIVMLIALNLKKKASITADDFTFYTAENLS